MLPASKARNRRRADRDAAMTVATTARPGISAALERQHTDDFAALAERLDRRGASAETIVESVRRFEVAVPSWAFGTGGTRFGRFPGAGEPRNVFEKLEDAAQVHRLTRGAPRV